MAKTKTEKSELERLREAVGLEDEPEQIPMQESMQPPMQEPIQQEFEPSVEEALESSTVPFEPSEKGDTELFVKIEEHTDVATILNNSKKDIKSIIETISLLAKAEKLKADAIEGIEKHLNTLDAKLQQVGIKLMAPEGLQVHEGNLPKARNELISLQSDLESLKSELSQLK